MNNNNTSVPKEDIANALIFLRRVVAYGEEAETLLKTVESLETALKRKEKHK